VRYKGSLDLGNAPVSGDYGGVVLNCHTLENLFCTLYALQATVRTVAALGSAPVPPRPGLQHFLALIPYNGLQFSEDGNILSW